jgi:DNA modification methylase
MKQEARIYKQCQQCGKGNVPVTRNFEVEGCEVCSLKYEDFLKTKEPIDRDTGIEPTGDINSMLYDFQRDLVVWALRRGRAALFCDCGLGKTPMQLEWARHVPGRVLILAPLAVAKQTVREGQKFGIDCHYARSQSQSDSQKIIITNYEMLDHFDVSQFAGIVLDESSILKSYSGKMRTKIIDTFIDTQYKLACTATPAPNDYLELGNHSEFLGVMDRWTMRSMFFVHDSQMFGPGAKSGDVRNYRLKGHCEDVFWRWVSSWGIMMRSPEDLNYKQNGFRLPPINYHESKIFTDRKIEGYLFPMVASTLHERIRARSSTFEDRARTCADLVNSNDEQWIVWCGLNSESALAKKLIDGAKEVKGSDSLSYKENTLIDFVDRKYRVLVTKPLIAGFGMNFQNCHNLCFLGLSDSWESYYQAVRRCWRFGQKDEVNVHVVVSDLEGKVLNNIRRKEANANQMLSEITAMMSKYVIRNVKRKGSSTLKSDYKEEIAEGKGWELYLGDSAQIMPRMEADSIDYSIFSPPFMSLFIYSDSVRDIGNSIGDEKFFEHLGFVYRELYRITKPGRLVSIHSSDIPRTKNWDGYMGLRDLRGEIVREMEKVGFNYHSGVSIWKNPVVEMQRTKALGLLYKQLRKDSTRSRMGTADYISTFRKPGDNAEPVEHTEASYHLDKWQQVASPVWMDIVQGNTLQKASAREHKDEKHVCPLQLDVIERCLELWSNHGDKVFSPFAGIGSEGYVALQLGRKFVGIELKESYYKQAVKNLTTAKQRMGELFEEKTQAE